LLPERRGILVHYFRSLSTAKKEAGEAAPTGFAYQSVRTVVVISWWLATEQTASFQKTSSA
jgi:hypothetical protein